MAGHRKKLLLRFVVLAVLTTGGVASPASASPRSGTLTVYKECSEYTSLTGSFCTIKTSNIDQIKAGSKVVYLQPKSLASDVVLDPPGPGDDKAYGRCSLNKAGNGTCVFTRGTGVFNGFHATLRVKHLGDPSDSPFYYWHGPYSFSP
jgi:hypothetical protein